jgi:hypothetical protein
LSLDPSPTDDLALHKWTSEEGVEHTGFIWLVHGCKFVDAEAAPLVVALDVKSFVVEIG